VDLGHRDGFWAIGCGFWAIRGGFKAIGGGFMAIDGDVFKAIDGGGFKAIRGARCAGVIYTPSQETIFLSNLSNRGTDATGRPWSFAPLNAS
jgi:hypothetical protein